MTKYAPSLPAIPKRHGCPQKKTNLLPGHDRGAQGRHSEEDRVMNKPTSESLAGAIACIKALQSAHVIERRGFDNPETNDNSVERYFRDRDEIKAVFAQGMGNPSPYQSGFLSTLAEYIHVSLAAGEPDVFDWKPETLMTESEVKEHREENIRFMLEDEAAP